MEALNTTGVDDFAYISVGHGAPAPFLHSLHSLRPLLGCLAQLHEGVALSLLLCLLYPITEDHQLQL